MDRKTFLKYLSLLPLSGLAMNLKDFASLTDAPATDKLPVLFVGHGSPMNIITDNSYRKEWEKLGSKLPVPKAILCISAHWLTRGTYVTMSEKPVTIHDFGGFPDELYSQQYPAPGAVEQAKLTIQSSKTVAIKEDHEWGLDHGAWCVLKAIYPKANIPVYQMSIDFGKPMEYHYNLAKELAVLRSKGVLIVASGNIVHNLGAVDFSGKTKEVDWAIEFDQYVKHNIDAANDKALIDYQKLGKLAAMAHPSNDHYIPLIYSLGLRDAADKISYFNESFDLGSISMRSVIFS